MSSPPSEKPSSLPAQGRVSPSTSLTELPDCRTCKRRRIRCDRGLPGCQKCSTRNLECPGYGANLRWANGIAVRGRFKGLNAPQLSQPETTDQPPEQTTLSSPSEGSVVGERANSERSASFSYPGSELLPNFPSDATVRQLLDHYDKNIAGFMVWLDSDANEYRRLVIPLALQHPGLLLSILAVSGQHLATTSNIESSFSQSACDAAVRMITQQVQQVVQRQAQGQDLTAEMNSGMVEWMLASMLILSNYAMVGSESSAADSHRQAARMLVNALAAERKENELYTFLKNQLSIYDVLACTTIFDSTSTGAVIMPEIGRSNVVFAEYLTLLHQVTLLSRGIFSHSSASLMVPYSEITSDRVLRGKFELARGSTLVASAALTHNHPLPRCRDFIRLVDIYHHAGLLYAYKSIYAFSEDNLHVQYSATMLFERLDELEDIPTCFQNLPWPVFIAGTVCHKNPERQGFVRALYHRIQQDMGFNHYSEILRFLNEFWSGPDENWLRKARESEGRGNRIIAV